MPQLQLPITPAQALTAIVLPAMVELGPKFDSPRAWAMLLAIAGQESGLKYRRQQPGPARGLWQFERGGGVVGVLTHPSSRQDAIRLCELRGLPATADAVYAHLEKDDIFAAGIARLLLWTLPGVLPVLGDEQRAWEQYIAAWRPGKPHRNRWKQHYDAALAAVRARAA